MNEKDMEHIKDIILTEIGDVKSEIEELVELTKPINPDKAIGRLSRMDAINNKSINESALRDQKSRLQKLNRAPEKI